MRLFRWFAVVAVLFLTSSCVSALEMSAAGKSAQEVFQDGKVVSLLQAVRDRDVAKAESLIREGANVNASGYEGVTPLIWMIYQHDYGAIELLLNLGADPNQPWSRGEAPVYMAASAGDDKLITLLLDHGGNPDSPDRGKSAMMIAIIRSHMNCADLLLRRGANINYHDGFSSTIMAPEMIGRFDWLVWVLDHGYTYDLVRARRGISNAIPVADQLVWKKKALEIMDQRIEEGGTSGAGGGKRP